MVYVHKTHLEKARMCGPIPDAPKGGVRLVPGNQVLSARTGVMTTS